MIQCNTLFKIERKNLYEMQCTKRVHDKSVNVQRRLASPLDYIRAQLLLRPARR